MGFTRGTTPTHVWQDIDIDLTDARVYVTYSQGRGQKVLEKTNEDLTITKDSISVTLSQEDTLRFSPGEVGIQIRYVLKGGTAGASSIFRTSAFVILKEGVITWQ